MGFVNLQMAPFGNISLPSTGLLCRSIWGHLHCTDTLSMPTPRAKFHSSMMMGNPCSMSSSVFSTWILQNFLTRFHSRRMDLIHYLRQSYPMPYDHISLFRSSSCSPTCRSTISRNASKCQNRDVLQNVSQIKVRTKGQYSEICVKFSQRFHSRSITTVARMLLTLVLVQLSFHSCCI